MLLEKSFFLFFWIFGNITNKNAVVFSIFVLFCQKLQIQRASRGGRKEIEQTQKDRERESDI